MVSAGDRLGKASAALVDEHLGTGEESLAKISKSEVVITSAT
jgi:hypothetical protein